MTRSAVVFLALCAASVAQSQDTIVTIEPVGGTQWQIVADFIGAPGPGPISSVWSGASFDLNSTDGVISGVDLNDGYDTSILGAPFITGQGTGSVSIRATMPGGPLLGPDNDSSNPLLVGTFFYTGTVDGFSANMVGENTIFFDMPPFGAVEFYQNAGGLNDRWLIFNIIPAPGVLAPLAGLGLVAGRRRR